MVVDRAVDGIITGHQGQVPPGPLATPATPLEMAFTDLIDGGRLTHLWSRLGWQDIRRRYRRSVLGPLWLTISMGLMVALLGTLYGRIFKVGAADYHGTGARVGRDARNRLSVRALDDGSVAFEHGDRVGVIGRNGAGKTTLLRVLAGVYEPASGRVWRRGRTASLLNVSLGIDPEATGYENIMTRGLLVGLKPEEVRERTEEIAEFTELGDYLAMPANT